MRIAAVIFALLTATFATQAQARHHHYRHRHTHVATQQNIISCNRFGCRGTITATITVTRQHIADVGGSDPRPSAWCAWWLRRYLNIPRSAFRPYEWNLARGFLHIGSPAPRGCTNCIAVFSRGHGGHVGLVQSWDANGNPIILSGNYNGHVATAAHPASRLIGLRWPS